MKYIWDDIDSGVSNDEEVRGDNHPQYSVINNILNFLLSSARCCEMLVDLWIKEKVKKDPLNI